MTKISDESFLYNVYAIVEEIPEGKVATYGQIARLIGMQKNARLIGKVLSYSEFYGKYPCHRVVNHKGRLVPGWLEQRDLLLKEDITFKDDIHVNIKECIWKP